MRRVLFLAYYFPPIGGGGVQRSVKFVRYLPELGYEPVVITGPGPALDRAPTDESLRRTIPPATEIRRVPGPEPARSRKLRGRAERWLRLDRPFARWWIEGAVTAGREVSGVDLVYASMSPFESGVAAAKLAQTLGKPWVADLRDPWALDEWRVYPTGLHRRLELRLMRTTLATADAVVMNTAEAASQLRKYFPELRDKPVVTIPNGFDAADFAGPAPERDEGRFRIVHAGWSHTAQGRHHRRMRLARRLLGGTEAGLDILTRSHVYLLEAIDRLVAARAELARIVEVHLAGLVEENETKAKTPYAVRNLGYLSHRDTIALLRAADLLFLPMHDLPRGVRSRIVPGKTYEYLAAGPPILAAVPEGDARDLLERAGNAFICRPADVTAMARVIEEQVDRWRAGEKLAGPRTDVVSEFERLHLTARLAQLFDRVVRTETPPRPVEASTAS